MAKAKAKRGGRRFGLSPEGESARTTMRWPTDVLAWIDAVADRDALTRSAVVRQCVDLAMLSDADADAESRMS